MCLTIQFCFTPPLSLMPALTTVNPNVAQLFNESQKTTTVHPKNTNKFRRLFREVSARKKMAILF